MVNSIITQAIEKVDAMLDDSVQLDTCSGGTADRLRRLVREVAKVAAHEAKRENARLRAEIERLKHERKPTDAIGTVVDGGGGVPKVFLTDPGVEDD